MPALTGYALTRHFRKLRVRVAPIITPLQAYLFFELIAICNEAEWPADFSATNGELQAGLGCSEEGLIRARLRLKEVGLIDFVSGNRRTPTRYWFTVEGSGELSHLAPKGSAKGSDELSNPAQEGSGELSHEAPKQADGSAEGSGGGSGELSPYKEQTKTKRTIAQLRQNDEAPEAATFDAFWEAYDKRRDRFKCEKKWEALSADEQAAALAHAPLFAAATPDKQFRKDPLTYLNGKCWLDEELPAPRNGAAAQPVPAPAASLPAPKLNAAFLAQQTAAAEEAEDAHFARFAVA